MNTLDLTKTGGFPFTQDMLDWIQQNSLAVMNMLGAKLLPDSLANTANTPVGLVGINPGTTQIYKAGWLWYNNEILHFPTDIDASGLPTLSPASGLVYGFAIQETDMPVSYFDGTSHNTKISRTVTIAAAANTLTATFIPLTTVIYYFDNGLRELVESSVSISLSGISGTVYYRKNFMSNNMQVRGRLTITPAVVDPPGIQSAISALPTGYRPANTVPIWAQLKNFGNAFPNVSGTDYIMGSYMEILADGTINILPIKSSSASSYEVSFNIIIPLD
ncbi:MAG: hypothetical protein JSS96_15260 [Bacteroidetes bacterium]|nr:hypothetical protein [Bacteroidota bacterium]